MDILFSHSLEHEVVLLRNWSLPLLRPCRVHWLWKNFRGLGLGFLYFLGYSIWILNLLLCTFWFVHFFSMALGRQQPFAQGVKMFQFQFQFPEGQHKKDPWLHAYCPGPLLSAPLDSNSSFLIHLPYSMFSLSTLCRVQYQLSRRQLLYLQGKEWFPWLHMSGPEHPIWTIYSELWVSSTWLAPAYFLACFEAQLNTCLIIYTSPNISMHSKQEGWH